MLRRRVGQIALVGLLGLTAPVAMDIVSAPPVSASASSCGFGLCNFVNGSGTWVQNLGVRGANFRGNIYRVEAWGSNFYFSGPGICAVNWHGTIAFTLNRNLPRGSWVTVRVVGDFGTFQRSFQIR
jgi:hypothetical protein